MTEERKARVAPGRSMTAIGMDFAMWRQRSQRWKSRSESAPMIQTKSTPGFRLFTRSIVSAEKRSRWAASKAVTLMRGSTASFSDRAMRAASGASSRVLFSGLPGVTIHQSWSSRSLRSAMSATSRWPACGGLKEPPNSPTCMPFSTCGMRR